MFSIFNEFLQKRDELDELLIYECSSMRTYVGQLFVEPFVDQLERCFNNSHRKNDQSIIMRCYLRDFVGLSLDSGRFNYFFKIISRKPTEETFHT